MDDVSDFFKSGFLSLHKNTTGKNYQQKTLKDRMNNFNNIRRETRNTLIFQKRQIDKNMTPINTPEPSKFVKKIIEKKEENKPNKRLEMLNKWKAEKEKRKQEQQKKAKPLFKVCHVPVEVGLPNLENINKEIKGKLIKSIPTPIKSQFAPPNHKFRAPKNIAPINISYRGNNTSLLAKSNMGALKTKSSEVNGSIDSKRNPISQRSRTRAMSRAEQSKLNEKQSSTVSSKYSVKTEINKTNSKQNDFMPEKKLPVNFKIAHKDTSVTKIKEPIKKSSTSINTRKKLQFTNNTDVENVTNTPAKHSSVNKHGRAEKTNKEKTPLVDLTPSISDNKRLPRYKEQDVKRHKKIISPKNKITSKEVANSKDGEIRKSSRIMKQLKIKQHKSMNPSESLNSTDISSKKVGWKVIEIIESDDEVFSKEIDYKTPKKIIKKYKKTPKKEQKIVPDTESGDDITIVANKTNVDENDESNILSSKCFKKPSRKSSSKSDEEAEHTIINTSTNTEMISRKSTVGSATGSASPDFPVECISSTDKSFDNSLHTPLKKNVEEVSTVYISPFVTVSRGKSSARKEYQAREESMCGVLNDSPEFGKDISNNVSPKAGADYFTKKLNNEITRIEGMCHEWCRYKDQNDCPEEANDMIDVAIGQSRLLISKKFQQFRNLIDQCRNCEYTVKPITCIDLHGFWDMIYMQVEDLNKRFNSLNILKMNNWQEIIVPEQKPIIKRGRGRPKKAAASSTLKNLIKAARNMKKSNEDGGNMLVPKPDEIVFSGGYYSIKSPSRDERKSPLVRRSNARKSLRASVLAAQAKSRVSSSPGLTMMKISQAIKSGDGQTPSKSILKTDLSKSANRNTKSVLFRDDLEENIDENITPTKSVILKNVEDDVKENDLNELNLINFSPVAPTRRSRRLSKMN